MWYTLIIPTLCTYYKRCFILFMLCMSLQYTYIISLNYTLLLPSICFKHMPLFYAHYYFLFFSHFCNYMLIIPMLYFSVPKRSSRVTQRRSLYSKKDLLNFQQNLPLILDNIWSYSSCIGGKICTHVQKCRKVVLLIGSCKEIMYVV